MREGRASRSLEGSFDDRPFSDRPRQKKVFIGNLPVDVTDADLRPLVEKAGPVRSLHFHVCLSLLATFLAVSCPGFEVREQQAVGGPEASSPMWSSRANTPARLFSPFSIIAFSKQIAVFLFVGRTLRVEWCDDKQRQKQRGEAAGKRGRSAAFPSASVEREQPLEFSDATSEPQRPPSLGRGGPGAPASDRRFGAQSRGRPSVPEEEDRRGRRQTTGQRPGGKAEEETHAAEAHGSDEGTFHLSGLKVFAPDGTITQGALEIASKLTRGDLRAILEEIQSLSAQMPATARKALSANPLLCHALLHAQLALRMTPGEDLNLEPLSPAQQETARKILIDRLSLELRLCGGRSAASLASSLCLDPSFVPPEPSSGSSSAALSPHQTPLQESGSSGGGQLQRVCGVSPSTGVAPVFADSNAAQAPSRSAPSRGPHAAPVSGGSSGDQSSSLACSASAAFNRADPSVPSPAVSVVPSLAVSSVSAQDVSSGSAQDVSSGSSQDVSSGSAQDVSSCSTQDVSSVSSPVVPSHSSPAASPISRASFPAVPGSPERGIGPKQPETGVAPEALPTEPPEAQLHQPVAEDFLAASLSPDGPLPIQRPPIAEASGAAEGEKAPQESDGVSKGDTEKGLARPSVSPQNIGHRTSERKPESTRGSGRDPPSTGASLLTSASGPTVASPRWPSTKSGDTPPIASTPLVGAASVCSSAPPLLPTPQLPPAFPLARNGREAAFESSRLLSGFPAVPAPARGVCVAVGAGSRGPVSVSFPGAGDLPGKALSTQTVAALEDRSKPLLANPPGFPLRPPRPAGPSRPRGAFPPRAPPPARAGPAAADRCAGATFHNFSPVTPGRESPTPPTSTRPSVGSPEEASRGLSQNYLERAKVDGSAVAGGAARAPHITPEAPIKLPGDLWASPVSPGSSLGAARPHAPQQPLASTVRDTSLPAAGGLSVASEQDDAGAHHVKRRRRTEMSAGLQTPSPGLKEAPLTSRNGGLFGVSSSVLASAATRGTAGPAGAAGPSAHLGAGTSSQFPQNSRSLSATSSHSIPSFSSSLGAAPCTSAQGEPGRSAHPQAVPGVSLQRQSLPPVAAMPAAGGESRGLQPASLPQMPQQPAPEAMPQRSISAVGGDSDVSNNPVAAVLALEAAVEEAAPALVDEVMRVPTMLRNILTAPAMQMLQWGEAERRQVLSIRKALRKRGCVVLDL
ncbi:UNVERIFIED_CONTAM: RNA recognition motif-containing protein [Hammondia hammondi]|eukprot:XP_008885040.1 RNA recognition motif-containing protein [Hammondia hammondi]